jgi:hypothetical protein
MRHQQHIRIVIEVCAWLEKKELHISPCTRGLVSNSCKEFHLVALYATRRALKGLEELWDISGRHEKGSLGSIGAMNPCICISQTPGDAKK